MGALARWPESQLRCSYSIGLGLCSTNPRWHDGKNRGRRAMAAEPQGSKDATPATCAHNHSLLAALPFGDRADFEDAARGFIGTLPKVEFRNDQGRVIY